MPPLHVGYVSEWGNETMSKYIYIYIYIYIEGEGEFPPKNTMILSIKSIKWWDDTVDGSEIRRSPPGMFYTPCK